MGDPGILNILLTIRRMLIVWMRGSFKGPVTGTLKTIKVIQSGFIIYKKVSNDLKTNKQTNKGKTNNKNKGQQRKEKEEKTRFIVCSSAIHPFAIFDYVIRYCSLNLDIFWLESCSS